MLAFGIVYLQNHLGLEPCPMCIVQRYALIGVIVWCLLGIGSNAPVRTFAMTWLIAITSAFGAFVAARQSGFSGTHPRWCLAAAIFTA